MAKASSTVASTVFEGYRDLGLGMVWGEVGVSFPCTRCSYRRKPSSFTYTPARTRAADKDWGVGCSTSQEKSGKARSKQDVRMVRQTQAAKADEH